MPKLHLNTSFQKLTVIFYFFKFLYINATTIQSQPEHQLADITSKNTDIKNILKISRLLVWLFHTITLKKFSKFHVISYIYLMLKIYCDNTESLMYSYNNISNF